ncbi:metallophosphoesterase [Pseudoroseicyclus tamaricis]|uniref:Serine/threonine protein phosphatase n=1 Tax=Pseudoroseicyclus tamaricis TaxID=2705421 RepID=A0A6B2K4L8_9RHOB|nr:metallophosphoesterase [Pseudoroseicyclus tamaricis]NDV02792.1 serine/threonine protein phosphatase [Pseudoroseicyclus tamaricis]
MKSLLSRFRRSPKPAFTAPLAPEEPLALIGDVHGTAALLDGLLARLKDEAPEHRVIMLGDYVDRGDHAAAVLRRLMALDAVCVMGNHEAMCLDFLDKPARAGERWLRNGGLQTLASFGIGGLGLAPTGEQLEEAADRLSEAMGAEMIAWLRGLPMSHASGNVVAIHAGGDPLTPISEQRSQDCLWGHPRFASEPRSDGMWVAHGHVIVPEPSAAAGRIAVDTGAYATGCLTAALVEEGSVRFLQHRAEKSGPGA